MMVLKVDSTYLMPCGFRSSPLDLLYSSCCSKKTIKSVHSPSETSRLLLRTQIQSKPPASHKQTSIPPEGLLIFCNHTVWTCSHVKGCSTCSCRLTGDLIVIQRLQSYSHLLLPRWRMDLSSCFCTEWESTEPILQRDRGGDGGLLPESQICATVWTHPLLPCH